jgi:hypothetical protein
MLGKNNKWCAKIYLVLSKEKNILPFTELKKKISKQSPAFRIMESELDNSLRLLAERGIVIKSPKGGYSAEKFENVFRRYLDIMRILSHRGGVFRYESLSVFGIEEKEYPEIEKQFKKTISSIKSLSELIKKEQEKIFEKYFKDFVDSVSSYELRLFFRKNKKPIFQAIIRSGKNMLDNRSFWKFLSGLLLNKGVSEHYFKLDKREKLRFLKELRNVWGGFEICPVNISWHEEGYSGPEFIEIANKIRFDEAFSFKYPI